MRARVKRLLGVSALYLLFGLGLPACSGQQQDQEDLEISEQEEFNQSAENTENENLEQSSNEEYSNVGDEYSDNTEMTNIGEGTENDLQEIIQEMNGQQTDTAMADDMGYDATALQPEATEMAPVDTTMNTAAAPMEAAPAAPMDMAAPAAAPSSMAMPFQPGGSPAAPGLPELGSKMAYVVEQGDTLGKISQKIYGTTARWNELATLSGLANPSRIYPGDLIYYTLDESAISFAAAYESVPRAEEQVQPGDTLASIARRVYGSSNAWRAIWRQNDRIDNPDIVPPGTTVIYIPHGAATAAVKKAQLDRINLAKAQQIEKAPNHKIDSIKSVKTEQGRHVANGQTFNLNAVAA